MSTAYYRACFTLSRLLSCNEFDYHGCLTFDYEKCGTLDYSRLLKMFRSQLDYYHRKNPDFAFIYIPDISSSGRLHVHFLFKNVDQNDIKVNRYGYYSFHRFSSRLGFIQLGVVPKSDDLTPFYLRLLHEYKIASIGSYYGCSRNLLRKK